MAYVIAQPCIGVKDTACVDACPADCVHPRKDEPGYAIEEMLYIDPAQCIDCGACVPVCMQQTFGSTCHGAGRLMSRAKARTVVRGDQLRHRLESRGIVVRAGSMRDFAEETPEAYKNVSQVVGVVARAGIAKLVARLEPLAVVKG